MEPMRSMLFTPGHRHDLVAKAIASGTDAVIVDLEDAVALEEKPTARAGLKDLPPSDVPMYVRTKLRLIQPRPPIHCCPIRSRPIRPRPIRCEPYHKPPSAPAVRFVPASNSENRARTTVAQGRRRCRFERSRGDCRRSPALEPDLATGAARRWMVESAGR